LPNPIATLLIASALTLFGAAGAAQSQPSALEAAERSVVRVISVSVDQAGQVTDVEEGSGFFVAPGKVVTNDHVVAGATGAALVRVFVIPERDTGERRQETSATAAWPQADLALLSVPAIAAPALTIATTVPGKDSTVHALGYPGVTDAIRQLSLEAVLAPGEPYVTPGAVALTSRTAPGGGAFETIFHTAPINPGNSGGPLIDACGRVIGVNAWVGSGAVADNGQIDTYQGQFAAVGASVVAQFLAAQGVAVSVDATACKPPLDAAIETRLAAAEASIAAEAKARADFEARYAAREGRDRLILIGIVALVALAAAGIAVLAAMRGRSGGADRAQPVVPRNKAKPPGAPARGVPMPVVAVLLVAAIAIAGGLAWIVSRGAGGMQPPAAAAPGASATPAASRFEVTCQAVAAAGASAGAATTTGFTIEPGRACINGRTPYERSAAGFSRVITSEASATVSSLTISADLTRFERRDFVLGKEEFAALRDALGAAAAPRCDGPPDPAADRRAEARLAAIRVAATPFMQGEGARRFAWRCTAVPWR
jgi:S1-C subfamily serine protease